ncbi:MAG: DUF2508 family protein [Bacillota bacterium]
MKILEKTILKILSRISPHYPARPDLLANIQNSLAEWKTCNNQYNFTGPEMIDYMIYRLNAAERHYMALLAQARREGLKAWPDGLKREIRSTPFFSSAPNNAEG